MSNGETTNYDNCLVVKVARVLAEEMAEREGDPEVKYTTYDDTAIAKIRHTCTNYDDLLEELNEQFDSETGLPFYLACYRHGICTFDLDRDIDDECPGKKEAYWVIKEAANKLARELLPKWRARAEEQKSPSRG